MAGRLSGVASRIMGGNGVVARSVGSSLRQRAGMGLPVGKHIVPDKPVSRISLLISSSWILSNSFDFETLLIFPYCDSAFGERRADVGQRDCVSRTLHRSDC